MKSYFQHTIRVDYLIEEKLSEKLKKKLARYHIGEKKPSINDVVEEILVEKLLTKKERLQHGYKG
jgi:hypothetical protein